MFDALGYDVTYGLGVDVPLVKNLLAMSSVGALQLGWVEFASLVEFNGM